MIIICRSWVAVSPCRAAYNDDDWLQQHKDNDDDDDDGGDDTPRLIMAIG